MVIYVEHNVASDIPLQSTFLLSLIRTHCGFYDQNYSSEMLQLGSEAHLILTATKIIPIKVVSKLCCWKEKDNDLFNVSKISPLTPNIFWSFSNRFRS